MPWWQLSVQCTQEQLEQTENLLLELGALSLSISDAADEPLYEPLPGEQPLWSNSIISGLFDQTQTLESLYDALARRLPAGQVNSLKQSELEDQQWERVHLERYQPMRFGRNTWVCPSWCEPPEPDAINIIFDPGVAFGTGSHPTTALCLEYLDANPTHDLEVLDYGCGSGILAIAAARHGAAQVDCIDIDPQALTATMDNIERNGLPKEQFSVNLPANTRRSPVDLVMANILCGPLVELEPLFAELTRPGSRIMLSGILDTQVDSLMSAYAQHFDLDAATIREQWCRVTGRRR